MDVIDRWTGERIADVKLASKEEALSRPLADLSSMTSHARRDALAKISSDIGARKEEIARLIAREAGKPIAQARAEVERAASTFRVASEETTRIHGEAMQLDITRAAEGHSGLWRRVPRGDVLGITPFNFPLNLVAHKVAPALAVGASVMIKPALQTPLTALALEEIVRASGFHENALAVVPCENAVAEALVRSDRFRVLSFTGSDHVGWHLKSIAGKKHVLLELGGNAAAIVDDAIGDVAERMVRAAFAYAGQVCIKVQRLYVRRSIADGLIDEIVQRSIDLVPSDPQKDDTILGPMIDEANAKRVESWIEEAKNARALLRGKREGARLSPTILEFEGSGRGNKVVDEEVFGPVLTVHAYDDFEEALAMADDTRFGLQAGVFTDSLSKVQRAFEKLHVGGVIVNDVPTFRVDNMPYGGTRDSGLGREGIRSAIEELTEKKVLVMRKLS